MNNLLAISETPLGDPFNGIGPLGSGGSQAPTTFNNIITAAIGLITAVAGIWFIFLIVTGGIAWMGAGGDKAKVEDAQKRLSSGVIGLIIVIAGVYLADLIGYLLGLNLLDPGGVIDTLTP
jgi:hypothetical protein